jgi:hypothetical protein
MFSTTRSIFLGLAIAASLTACSLPSFSATPAVERPTASAPVAVSARANLQAVVAAGLSFTAKGVDLSAVTAAMNRADSMLTETYELRPVWPLVDYESAATAITVAHANATAQAVVVEAARVAAEVEAARLAAIQAAAVEASAARDAANAAAKKVAPRVSAPAAQKTPSVYQLKVVGVARNQADLDKCGVMDVSVWMGARQIATHWQCGKGYLIPRDAGQLFTVSGAGALDGNYVSAGIVGTLNQKTQTTNDIPHHYDLIVTTCLNNDSTRMMMLVLNRIP